MHHDPVMRYLWKWLKNQ